MTKNHILTVCFSLVSLVLFGQENIWSILNSGSNFEKICDQAEAYFKEKHPNMAAKQLVVGEHRDGEFVKYMRWKNYWETSLNPDGSFGDFTAYYLQKQENPQRSVFDDIYEDVEWSNISNTKFINLQISMGRTSCLAFHPTDPDIFYVGASIGGVWKTEDGGDTYTAMGDELPYLAVSSIVVDQENPEVLYISLGNHIWNGSPSIGVYKSENGGDTWRPTNFIFPTSINARIYWMAADPEDGQTILVTTNNGLYKTTDGFNSFRQVTNSRCEQVHYKYGDNSVVYLGKSNGEFLKSTDGGEQFSFIEDFGTRTVRIALTAQNPEKVVVTHGNEIKVSVDSGESFSITHTTPETFNSQVTSINPQNSEDYITGYFDLYRSIDGGANYNQITHWLGNNGLPLIHVDMRNTYINPLQNDRIYFCHDGGVDALNIETGEFINLSDGLIITQFYDIAVSQSNENVVSGGSQDNGSMYRDGNGTWDDLAGTGDGMITEIDPNNEELIYWEYQLGAMRRFNGSNNTNISPPNEDGEGAWITPYRLDPNDSRRIIAGYGRVYESLDRGDSWTQISEELDEGLNLAHIAIADSNGERIYANRTDKLFVKDTDADTWTSKTLPSGSLTDMEVNPLDMNHIVITVGGYTQGTKVFSSRDAGDTWENISGELPNVRFGAIEFYKDIDNAMFIGSEAGVYYMDDNHLDWVPYGKLPNTRINDIEIQYNAQKIRIGTYGRGVIEADIEILDCDVNSPDTDEDGICDAFDVCPDLDDNLIGQLCDDGDALSSNEMYSTNCTCEGGASNLTYCEGAGSSNTGSDYITFVQLNEFSNTSGKSDFSDFRHLSTELYEDSSYVITISLNIAFPLDTAFAWIDFDRSGTFETDELITMSSFENNTSTGEFTVEEIQELGATTMRVRNIFGSNVTADPCGGYPGEVEDYTIQLRNSNIELVDLDGDGFFNDVDCDDDNASINPGQSEVVYNGWDDDCNPATLDDDLDQDGFLVAYDCDDNNPDINPDAEEILNNGIDEDCDGADAVTSIHDLSSVMLNIYPNPASKVIYIDVKGQLSFSANLYDLEGKLLGSYKNVTEIEINSFVTGTYLLEIQDLNSSQKVLERIVIEN